MHKLLTEEQTRKLLQVLQGHHLKAIITLALVSGIRRDELLNLRWQDIDMEKHEMRVRSSKTKSYYLIHFPEVVSRVLELHRVRQVEARLEAGAAWQNLDLVFADSVGGPLGSELLLQAFHEILAQADLPHIRFHDLRVARYRALHERLRSAREGIDNAQAGRLDLDHDTCPF